MSQNNNIYDTANQLERELRESDSFKALQAQFEVLKNDEEAFKLFKDFRQIQGKVQQKAMLGQEVTEEDEKQMTEAAQAMGENDVIKKLMIQEQKVANLINDLNRIITEPLNQLYS